MQEVVSAPTFSPLGLRPGAGNSASSSAVGVAERGRGDAGLPLWILEPGPNEISGGWRFALRLATSVDREVTIACPAGSPVDLAALAAGVPVFNIDFPAPTLARGAAILANATLLRRSVPTDVIVVSGAIRASLVAGIARLPNPLVHLMHERDSAARSTVRLALRRSRAVVAVGHAAAETYRQALPRAHVAAVNNFLASSELAALWTLRETHTSRAPLPALGVVARLIPEKGVDELLEELSSIPDQWGRLLIAGDRQDEAYVRRLEERIVRSGLDDRVELLGPRSDIPNVLAQVDALVVPSTGTEGQPTVILEALAAGLPVLARAAVVGEEFIDLPVVAFDGASGLASALRYLPVAAADPAILAQRFAVGQVIGQLDAAASRAPRRSRRHALSLGAYGKDAVPLLGTTSIGETPPC